MGAKSGFDVWLEARLVFAELRSKTGDYARLFACGAQAKTLSAAIHK